MITRFAPSPTGWLHLGHAFSALTAWERARAADGRFLLRIEDIDRARCRAEYEAAIHEDLAWLGLAWPAPAMRQSDRLPAYAAALERLGGMGLIYPCRCTRADIRAALAAPQEGAGQDGPVYPGTCRARRWRDRGPGDALRLDMARAVAHLGGSRAVARLAGRDSGENAGCQPLDAAALIAGTGDVVLARRDIGTSYHLAVVVDDAAQGITEVVRGEDLLASTARQLLIYRALGAAPPAWCHEPLVRDENGRRLAKRFQSLSIRTLREQGVTPEEVLKR